MFASIWAFVQDPGNLAVLSSIGVVIVVIGGLWTAVQFFASKVRYLQEQTSKLEQNIGTQWSAVEKLSGEFQYLDKLSAEFQYLDKVSAELRYRVSSLDNLSAELHTWLWLSSLGIDHRLARCHIPLRVYVSESSRVIREGITTFAQEPYSVSGPASGSNVEPSTAIQKENEGRSAIVDARFFAHMVSVQPEWKEARAHSRGANRLLNQRALAPKRHWRGGTTQLCFWSWLPEQALA